LVAKLVQRSLLLVAAMVKIDDADRAEFKSLVANERKAFLASPLSSSSSSSSLTSNGRRRGGGGRALSVVVRKRPLFDAEKEKGLLDVVTAASNQRQLHENNYYTDGGGRSGGEEEAATNSTANVIVVHEPKTKYDLSKSISNHAFKFDAVFSEMSKTNDVYDRILRPLVNGLDRGAQIAVFAYGQTGSGKTYTMQGLTDMAIDDVFRIVLSPNGRARGLAVCISYFEIYCSKVFDLLNDRSPLVLREDGEGIVQVVGLTEHSTRDPRVLRALIDCGANCRSVGTTRVNADSSRSHGVLQLLIREGGIQRGNSSTTSGGGGGERHENFNNYDDDDDDDDDNVAGNSARLLGKLSLVDLAGSEQASESAPPDSQTHQEAAQINTSLLALKECIRAMGRGQKNMIAMRKNRHSSGGEKGHRRGTSMTSGSSRRNSNVSAKNHHHLPHTHIPFRGSKLTQILRECFTSEGASTVMVTCVSPGHVAAEHTIGSLRYADRLKGIAIRSNRNVVSSSTSTATGEPTRGGVDTNEEEDEVDGAYDEGEEELFDEGALVRKTSRLSIASSSSYTGKASKSTLSENSTGRQTGVLCNIRGEEVWPESAGPKPLSLVMMMMNAPALASSSLTTTNNINSIVGADMRTRAPTSRSRSSLIGNNSSAAVPPPSSPPPPSLPPPSSYHSLVPLSQHQFVPNFQSSTSAIAPPPLPLPPPSQTSSSSSSFVTNQNQSEATSTLSKQQQQQQRAVATAVATAKAASARVASASSKQQQPQQQRGKPSASSIPASPPPPLMSSMQRVDSDAVIVVKSPSQGGGKTSRITSLHDQQIDDKQGHKLFTSENDDLIQKGGRKGRGSVTHTEKSLTSTSAATTAVTISPPKRDGRGIKQVNDAADEWKGTIASIRQQQLKQKQEENEKNKKRRSSENAFHNASRSGAVTPEWDEELLGRQKPHLSSSSSDVVIATSPTPSPRHDGRRGVVDSNSSAVATTISAPFSSSLSSSSSSSSSIHKANVVSLLDMQIQELLILREKMTAATNSIAKSSSSSSSSVMVSSSMSPTSEKTAARVRLQPRNPAHELPFNVEGGLHKHRSSATSSLLPSSPPPPPPPFAIHHPQPSSPPPMQPPSLSLPFNSHFHQHSLQAGGGGRRRESTEDDVIGTNTRSVKSHGSSGHPLPPPLPSTKAGRNKLPSSTSSLSINGEEKILSPERRPSNRVKTTSQQGVTSGGKGEGQDSFIGFDQRRLYEEHHHQIHQQEPVRAVLRGQRQAGARGSATVSSSSSSGMIPRPYSSTSSSYDRVPQERQVSSIATTKMSDKERTRGTTKPSPYAEPLLANFNSSRNRVRRGSKASSQSSVDQSMMSMLMITSPAKPSLRSSFSQEMKNDKSAYIGGAGSAAEFRTRKY